ncbi:MAG: hypothetical protein HC927_01830 [Deltaproteobacteria bacterium]|nr:hypothetical protein [Deltaproteobacteria bacterium]
MDTLVLLGFLIDEVCDSPERYSGILCMTSVWRECREGSGPGTLDMNLDALVDISDGVAQFCGALSSVEHRLVSFGKCIPRQLLNERYSVSNVVFADFSTHRLRDLIAKLRTLVKLE